MNKYFPELYCDYSLKVEPVRDASTYSLRYKTIPIPTFSAFQAADRLFKMQPRLYLEICPFLYQSYSLAWVQLDLLTASNEELAEVAPCWSSALTGKDLLMGLALMLVSTRSWLSPTTQIA